MSSDEESHLSDDVPSNELAAVQEYETAAEPNEQDLHDNENDQQNLNQDEAKDKNDTKTKRVRNPQPKLDVERLRGPRGIRVLGKVFEHVKFRGSGYEQEDLNLLLKNYEYWCHRMFPKFPFDDCIEKMEKLGHKRFVQTYIKRIRMNLEDDDDDDDDMNKKQINDERVDEDSENEINFDNLTAPAVEPNNPSPPMLSEEQLRIIAANREKALKLREQLLNKNKTVFGDDLKQDLRDTKSSNNSIRPSQFTVQAEVHSFSNKFSTNDGDVFLEQDSRVSESLSNSTRHSQFTVQAEIHSCSNEFSINDDNRLSQQKLEDFESSNNGIKTFTVVSEVDSCSNTFAEVNNTPDILPNNSKDISILPECDFENGNLTLNQTSLPDGKVNGVDTNEIPKEVDVNTVSLLMEVDN